MQFIYHDGGRAEAGFKGKADDCVCRSIAIITGKPYREVYDAINEIGKAERPRKGRKRSTARQGVFTSKAGMKRYLESLGLVWTPTMSIGSGCTVHLADGELPMGRLIVSLSKHYTAVIDGVIYDTHDPQRATIVCENYIQRISQRCVYGYWTAHTEQ